MSCGDISASANAYRCNQTCLGDGGQIRDVYFPGYLVCDVFRFGRVYIGTERGKLPLCSDTFKHKSRRCNLNRYQLLIVPAT